MRIDNSGNVGIGTNSPATLLHVHNSSGNGSMQLISSTTGTSFINMGDTGDADAGQLSYINNDNAMAFKTNAGERMRIDSSGRLLLGTTTPSSYSNRLMTVGDASTTDVSIEIRSDEHSQLIFSDSSAADVNSQRGYIIYDHAEETFKFGAYDKEVMRFDSSGNILIGKTSTSDADVGSVINATQMRQSQSGTTAHDMHDFFRGTAGSLSRVGNIRTTGSATAYNTSSDYRLKENVVTDWDATSRLKQLKPSRFNFKIDKDTTVDGFLAHEVQSIVPEAVSGEKDAVDKDGNIEAQGIDHSKLVPLLTKALQEAISEIDTLKEKVTALESK
jgi:hypothetical protein